MKNIITVLFVLSSACLFSQTKDEALVEINKILKKAEGSKIDFDEVDGKLSFLKISKQTVFSDKCEMVAQVTTDPVTDIQLLATGINWGSFSYGIDLGPSSGYVAYNLQFKEMFNAEIKQAGKTSFIKVVELNFYVAEADLDRFVKLLDKLKE